MKTGFHFIGVNDPALFIDPQYQREPERSTVKRIQRVGWDPGKAGAILVNYRPDGKLAVIDGGNRLTIARMMGVEKIWCNIIQMVPGTPENPVAHEARMHVEMNADRKKNSAVQLWKAESNYDKIVIDANRIIEKHGFHVYSSRSRSCPVNSLACVDAIRKVLDMGGAELIDKVLSLVASAWPTARDARDAPIIRGLGHFIHFNPEHDPKRLPVVLSKRSPLEFIQEARKLDVTNGWSHYVGVSWAVLVAYNKDIRTKSRLLSAAHYSLKKQDP